MASTSVRLLKLSDAVSGTFVREFVSLYLRIQWVRPFRVLSIGIQSVISLSKAILKQTLEIRVALVLTIGNSESFGSMESSSLTCR